MTTSDGHWPRSRRVVTSVLEIRAAARGPLERVRREQACLSSKFFSRLLIESCAPGRVDVTDADEAAPNVTGQIAAIG